MPLPLLRVQAPLLRPPVQSRPRPVTLAHLAPHAALLAAGATLSVPCLREGHRGRHNPGHGHTRPHSRGVGTAQQDHNAIEGEPT